MDFHNNCPLKLSHIKSNEQHEWSYRKSFFETPIHLLSTKVAIFIDMKGGC